MTTTAQTNNGVINQNITTFANIQISDATIKLSLYIQKLIYLQENPSYQNQKKCAKILRLSYQAFLKYCQNEDFSKSVYQIVKSNVLNRKSYYSLYLLDLMIKNSKYVIKQAKKQLQTMMKTVWQKIWTQYDNDQKIENLKIIIKCWGYIYSQKIQENIRKWLDNKYNIKRIQLKEENQKVIRQIYGDKTAANSKISYKQSQNKISQALLHSLVDDDVNSNSNNLGSFTNLVNFNRQSSQGNLSGVKSQGKITGSDKNFNQIPSNLYKKSSSGSSGNITVQVPKINQQTKQSNDVNKGKLDGVSKGLRQALDLD